MAEHVDDGAAGPESPELAAFRARVRAFLAEHAPPRKDVSPWALHQHTTEEDARAHFENGRAWQRKVAAAGLAGLTYPVAVGGQGLTADHERIYREEVAAVGVTAGFISSTTAMLGPTLMRHGTPEQQLRYLPRLLSGEDAWCQLFSEPGAGSDLAGLACRAERDGDEFIVTGQKVWNSAAQFCDHGMLLVRTNPDAPKHAGITFLLVEDMSAPGIEVRPLVQATGAAHFNEVFLSEVRIPVANVLGEIDAGWAPARTVLSNESAFIGGGGGGSTNERLVTLARHFGRTADPVIRDGLMRHLAAERAQSLLGERIMGAVRRREVPPVDPSILKLGAARNRELSGDLAMALAGPAALCAGDERIAWIQTELIGRYNISIGGGTNEVQRNNLAERALGLPKEPGFDKTTPWRDIPRS